MKIKRFTAPSMREAMRLVRDQQGPDAVILSSNRVSGGVEVVAAIDYDEALIREAMRSTDTPEPKPTPQAQPKAEAKPQTPPAKSSVGGSLASFLRTPAQAPVPAANASTSARSDTSKIVWAQDPALQKLSTELSGMREMLEAQREAFMDREVMRDPQRAKSLQMMEGLGFSHDIAREIASALPAATDEASSRYLPMGWLARKIPVLEQDPIDKPGIIALVGPTGVGKTTTLAKLAAKAVERYGRRSVVMLSLDTYRVSAQEQLSYYGRLLGVPVSVIGPGDNLAEALVRVADCPMVLVDTAGISPRDARLHSQLERLAECGRARCMLVLPANGQRGDLEDAAERFSTVSPIASILTKVDETGRLGESLSVAIRRNLPVAYITDGQQVPEDIHRAKAPDLTIRAVHLARRPAHDQKEVAAHA